MNRTFPSALAELKIEPVIAYRGPAPEWAHDMEVTNPYFSFWFIEWGQACVEWPGGRETVTAGQAILLPSGLRRHHRISNGTRMISISFWARWVNGQALLRLVKPRISDGAEARQLKRIALRVTSAAEGHPPLVGEGEFTPAQWLKLHGELEVFVAAILTWASSRGGTVNPPPIGDARLDAILKDLATNLHAGALPFDRWTDLTGLSRVQLDRLALRWLGASLRRRRDELLLDEIRRSLSRGRESLKELSARLGFFDAPHFTRWVKARTGRNPSELRGMWV
jgi:AraC-like DNA-binding protein